MDYVNFGPRKHVIHTVGPVYSTSNVESKASLLASCYSKSLHLAVEHSLKHIVSDALVSVLATSFYIASCYQAFPSISTGVYGYPVEDATRIALNETRIFLDSNVGTQVLFCLLSRAPIVLIKASRKLDRVIFVVWGNRDKGVYE